MNTKNVSHAFRGLTMWSSAPNAPEMLPSPGSGEGWVRGSMLTTGKPAFAIVQSHPTDLPLTRPRAVDNVIAVMRIKPRAWMISVLPGALWEALLLGAPFVGIVLISFMTRGEYGSVERPFTFENYKQLAGFGPFGFEALYPVILLRTVLLAFVTSVLCAAAALPLVFFVAALSARKRTIALMLLTIPVWTNLLVRTYAWQVLLGPESWLTRAAAALGFIAPGEALYPSFGAVLICLVCDFLPFAALPLYASVEKLNRATIEAARDLGASGWNVFRHAVYPQVKPGLWAGLIFVFLPALGQFVIPDLLGGAKTVLLGNILQQQFGASRDWPFGAAVATVSILILALILALYARKAKEDLV